MANSGNCGARSNNKRRIVQSRRSTLILCSSLKKDLRSRRSPDSAGGADSKTNSVSFERNSRNVASGSSYGLDKAAIPPTGYCLCPARILPSKRCESMLHFAGSRARFAGICDIPLIRGMRHFPGGFRRSASSQKTGFLVQKRSPEFSGITPFVNFIPRPTCRRKRARYS